MYRALLRYIAAIFVLLISSYFIFDESFMKALKFTILMGIIFVVFEFLDKNRDKRRTKHESFPKPRYSINFEPGLFYVFIYCLSYFLHKIRKSFSDQMKKSNGKTVMNKNLKWMKS